MKLVYIFSILFAQNVSAMKVVQVAFLLLYLSCSKSSSSLRNNIPSFFNLKNPSRTHVSNNEPISSNENILQNKVDRIHKDSARWAFIEKFVKDTTEPTDEDENKAKETTNRDDTKKSGKTSFHINHALNVLRRSGKHIAASTSSSSSREMDTWKSEFEDMWMYKKLEALNQSKPRGDEVNMVAARPWGVSCGDPDSIKAPSGTCVLAPECDSEFRIYRGDLFCGRTRFVCCAILPTNYDMYQGFDVSLDEHSFSTDSDERRDRDKQDPGRKKRRKEKERKKRVKLRTGRKRKIRQQIKKIIKIINKILQRQYRNATRQKKKRTEQLKKLLKNFKKQYRHDRNAVFDLRDKNLLHIDQTFKEKLNQIMSMNRNFMNNMTFRELVVNGTLSKDSARILASKYPSLASMLRVNRRAQPIQNRLYSSRRSRVRLI